MAVTAPKKIKATSSKSAIKTQRTHAENTRPVFSKDPEISRTQVASNVIHPWPEWVDQDYNSEKWPASPKGGSAKGTPSKKSLNKRTPNKDTIEENSKNSSSTKRSQLKLDYFVDIENTCLPEPILELVQEWKRPHEIYQEKDNIVLYNKYSESLTRFTVTTVPALKAILAVINCLEYWAKDRQEGLYQEEGISGNYKPNSSGPWRPWHHVYAMCKSGPGTNHEPKINPEGKYIIRLFHMGCWRKIIVDDQLPLDGNGLILLPCSITDNEVIELWPALLIKALIKIMRVNGDQKWGLEAMEGYGVMESLTGWSVQQVDLNWMSKERIWSVILRNSDHWSNPKIKIIYPTGAIKDQNKTTSTKSGKSKSSSSDSKKVLKDKKNTMSVDGSPRYLLATWKKGPEELSKFLNFETDLDQSCALLIQQCRTSPLETETKPEKLADWKRLRWVSWAIKHGVKDTWSEPDIRCLRAAPLPKNFQIARDTTRSNDIEIWEQKEVSSNQKLKSIASSRGKTGFVLDSSRSDHSKRKSKITDLSFSWLDFHLASEFLDRLYIIHRPSQFPFSIKISDLAPTKVKKSEKSKGKSKSSVSLTSEKKVNEKLWSSTLLKSRNESLLLFVDSADKKTFHIRYCTLNLNAFGTADDAENKSNESDYVLIDEFHWNTEQLPTPILSLKRNSADSLNLAKGRIVLRFWIKCSSTYTLQIYSDTQFEVGSFEKISELMNFESINLINLVNQLGDCFLDLIESFGETRFSVSLKKFYTCYRPDIILNFDNKSLKQILHDSFINNICRVLKDNCKKNEEYQDFLRALRVLFINPNIGRNYIENQKNYGYSNDFDLLKHKAATKIQSWYKRYIVQKLKTFHVSQNNRQNNIINNLRKIYDILFSPKKREIMVPKIIREFLQSDEIIADCYSFSKDLKFVLKSSIYRGVLKNVRPDSWIAITRFVVFCHSRIPTWQRIELFCPLPLHILRVFNNDTNQELKHFGNGVGTCEYKQNNNGYTILAYGWSDNKPIKDVPWKLVIYCEKDAQVLHVCDNNLPNCRILPTLPLITDRVMNYYIPCITNRMFRCLVKVKENSLLSLGVETSLKSAKVAIKCLNEDGITIGEVVGRGNVVYPVLLLEYDQDLNDSPVPTLPKSEETSKSSIGSQQKKRTSKISSLNSCLSDSITEITVADFRPKHLRKTIRKSGSEVSSKKSIDSKSAKLGMQTLAEKVYVVEAILMDQSWPLYPEEWTKVHEETKKDSLEAQVTSIKSLSSGFSMNASEKTLSKNSLKSQQSDSTTKEPRWILEMVSTTGEPVKITEDRSRKEEILTLKRSWEIADPSGMQRGEKLRENFFKCVNSNRLYCLPSEWKDEEKVDDNIFVKRDILAKDYSKLILEENEESVDLANVNLKNLQTEFKNIVQEAYEEMDAKLIENKNMQEEIIFPTIIDPKLLDVCKNIKPLMESEITLEERILLTDEMMEKCIDLKKQEMNSFESDIAASKLNISSMKDEHFNKGQKMRKQFEDLKLASVENIEAAYKVRQKYLQERNIAARKQKIMEKQKIAEDQNKLITDTGKKKKVIKRSKSSKTKTK